MCLAAWLVLCRPLNRHLDHIDRPIIEITWRQVCSQSAINNSRLFELQDIAVQTLLYSLVVQISLQFDAYIPPF